MNFIDWTGNIIDSFTGLFRRRDGFYVKNYMIGQKGAAWIPVDKPFELYNCIPELKQVVDKKSLMFSNMELKLINSSTNELIEDKDFYNLINQPNPLQSMNDWLRQFKQQEQVYGNQFMYLNRPSKLAKYPITIFNVSPRYVKPYLSGKVFDQIKKEDIILYYEYTDGNLNRKFETKDIIYSRLNDLDNPIIGTSPLISLQFPLTNTKLAYEYRNVIMGEKGAIGILSAGNNKDSMGAIPLKKEEKQRLESAYRGSYGVQEGKMKIHITEANLNWQPMTYPTKDLLLFEEVDANKQTIIDHFGLNVNLFSNKNATFENVREGIKSTYRDTIIPEADQFCQMLTKELKIEKGKEIIASFDHLSILKDDEKDKSNVFKTQSDAISQLVSSGIIDATIAKTVLNNISGVGL